MRINLFLLVLLLIVNIGLVSWDKDKFVLVEGGTFMMGSDSKDAAANEKPVHKVTVSSFWISKYEVTQAEWNALMDPSKYPVKFTFKNPELPVDSINWYQALEYCNELSKKHGFKPAYIIDKEKKDPNNLNNSDNIMKYTVIWDLSADGYRLPTEAEWEYAARGGKLSKNYIYSGSNNFDEVGYCLKNSNKTTYKPGTKKPNELGIYDMSGNVIEWCWDWFSDKYYSVSPEFNPTGPEKGEFRCGRGGSWKSIDESYCRNTARFSAHQWFSNPLIGFRLVRSVINK